MKKKIIVISLFIIGLFIVTGCGEKNRNLKKVEYKDEIVLGQYNGEDITWVVLNDISAPKDTVLVISKKILDVKPLNDSKTEISWEESSLNKWLNTEFLNETFDENVINEIIINSENGETNKITILSSLQLERYLPTDDNRIADSTIYMLSHASDHNISSDDFYWTKTKCGKDKYAYEAVNSDEGWIRTGGMKVTDEYGVRPAFWIKKDTIIETN